MRIAVDIPPPFENDLREAIARGDESKLQQVLLQVVRPTVESMLGRAPAKLSDEQFESLADELADELEGFLGPNAPLLSDEAISRTGLYGDHL
jgi:hypothetical protein